MTKGAAVDPFMERALKGIDIDPLMRRVLAENNNDPKKAASALVHLLQEPIERQFEEEARQVLRELQAR